MRKLANEALSAKHWQPISRDDAFPGFDSWHFSRLLGSHHWRPAVWAVLVVGTRKPLHLHKSNHGTKMTTKNENGIPEVIELLSK